MEKAERERIAKLNAPRRWASPLDMACDLDKSIVRTPALELINRSLVAMTDGTGPSRLATFLAPQEGKSTLCSLWYPLWLLVCNPELRIIIVSYSDEIARRWGADIKLALETWNGDEGTIDLGLRLRTDTRAAGRWQVEGHRGGVFCAGVGGSITGRPGDCLAGETRIVTPSGYVPIRDIRAGDLVLSYNHNAGRTEWRTVLATRAIPDRPLIEVTTGSGRRFRCTPDHRVHIAGGGYIPAADLQPGTRLVAALPGADQVHQLRIGIHPAALRPVAHEGGSAAALLEGLSVRIGDPEVDLRGLRGGVHAPALRGGEGETERFRQDVLHEEVLPGDRVSGASSPEALRQLRQVEAPGQALLLDGVPPDRGAGRRDLLSLREDVPTSRLRTGEAPTCWTPGVLFAGVRGTGVQGCRPAVHDVQETNRVEGSQTAVLWPRLSAGSEPGWALAECVPDVRGGVLAEEFTAAVLRPGLRRSRSLGANDRSGQLALQGRHQLRGVVPADAPADPRARRISLPRVWPGRHAGSDWAEGRVPGEVDPRCAPSQRDSVGQPPREPHDLVPALSHAAPQVEADTVHLVRDLCGERDTVYDIQVDGNSNFFAGEVLVHNCIIVDDPLKNLEEAQSDKYRSRVMRTYQGVLIPRMAPGTKISWIQTLWHEAEPIQEILANEGDAWRVNRIPAIADSPDDPLGREIGEPMQSARGERDWATIRRDVGEYVFAALYQQRPSPAEGGLFKRLWWRYWSMAPRAGMVSERIDLAGRIVSLGDCWRFITGDLANSTKSSADWTVASAWALTLDGDLILLDRQRGKVGETGHFDLFRPLAQRWDVDTVFVEKSQYGTTLVVDATKSGLHISPLDAEVDKFSRALPYSARASGGRMWLPAGATWLGDWTNEHAAFPNGSHDDQVDTGSYAVRVAVTRPMPSVPKRLPTRTNTEIDLMNTPM